MRFVELELENFRGIKKAVIKFDGQNTDIYGDNGTGKTTIANAISWILTDQPITGEKDFSPKTQGTHDLHHIARLKVSEDGGAIHTFEKDFHEVWKKKRGSTSPEFSGHVTDYAVCGVPQKKKEYEEAISAACRVNADLIKQLIIPGYFAEVLRPEDRRRILFDMCGDVDDDTVIRENSLEALTEVLLKPGSQAEYYTCDEYKKIATEQRRRLNKELEALPERIDELQRGVSDDLPKDDVETLRRKLIALEQEREELIASNSKDSKKEALRAAIAGVRAGMEEGRAKYLAAVSEAQEGFYQQISRLKQQQNEAQGKAIAVQNEIARIKEKMKDLQDRRIALLEEYQEAQAMTLDACVEYCPTCKQKLPKEQIEEIIKVFNRDKAERKKRINEQGQECSKERIEALEKKLPGFEREAADLTAKISELETEIQKYKEGMTSTKYEETEEYKEYSERLEALNAKHASEAAQEPVCDTEELDTTIYTLHEQIGAKIANEKATARIKELEEKQKEAGRNLEQVERGLHLCEEFIRAKVRMVTNKINSRFTTVSWLLFKEQINGGLKECCEAMIPNATGEPIEYKSANTAARINAGLEIVEALGNHYGASMPVIIDQAESVCKPREMKEQVIRLIVSEQDKTIRVEGK